MKTLKPPDASTFVADLKIFVEKKGGQRAASRVLGVTPAAICRWINGKRTPGPITIRAFARSLK